MMLPSLETQYNPQNLMRFSRDVLRAQTNIKRPVPLVAVVLLAVSTLLCMHLNAQVSGGSLSGTVTDSPRAAIPNVQVTITATGFSRTVVTDFVGFYTAPDLLPGSYEMTAAVAGFATQVRTG